MWDEDATGRVFTPVSGHVVRISRDFGQSVSRGTLLAEMSSPDFGQAQSDAARSDADLRAAERTFERVAQVYERGGASRKDRDQAEADLERARAEAARTRERLQLWGGSAPGRVDQTFPLRSPVDGVVVERNINPGQEICGDSTTPLFVVSDSRRLWVLHDVTERDVADIVPGAPLRLRTAAYDGRVFDGVLDTIGAGLDPATRTVRARGRVRNQKDTARRLLAPARAVMQDGEERFVFVEEAKGRYRRTPVKVGPEREGVVPVLSDLPDSTRIAVEGELLLESVWAESKGR